MKSLRLYLAAAAIAITGVAGAGSASAKPAASLIATAFWCKPIYYKTVRYHLPGNRDLIVVYHVHGKCFRHIVYKKIVPHYHGF